MITNDLGFYTILNGILIEVNNRLAETEAGQPMRVCVYPGLIAWDDCTCGQLAGSIIRMYPTESFPLPFSAHQHGESFSCPPPYVVAEMVISLVRCAPAPMGSALAPSCEALDAAAQTWTIDAAVARAGVLCRLQEYKDNNEIIDYRFETQTPVGPEGACVGTDVMALVGLPL